MRKNIFFFCFLFFFGLVPLSVHAENDEARDIVVPVETFYQAEVLDVQETSNETGQTGLIVVKLKILDGEKSGQEVESEPFVPDPNRKDQNYRKGDRLVVIHSATPERETYFIYDHYRLPALWFGLIVFVLFAILIAQRRAFFALLGLAFSLLILAKFMVPKLAQGVNPLLIGGLGTAIISIISLYVAHGWRKRTHIALLGMILTMIVATTLATVFVFVGRLFGTGSEDAYNLQLTLGSHLEFRGLFLLGVIIGALGVLDDITTSLVATVEAISQANRHLPASELFKRAFEVGKEHIASLINTLVFAYAGASLPFLLLFSLVRQPLWVVLNSQFMAEEIIRTLIGSTALILAVPITTLLASRAYVANRFASQKK